MDAGRESWFSQQGFRCRLEWGHDGARRAAARGDVLVIVDTLRFSTAVATAVHHGAIIFPCRPDEDAHALDGPRVRLRPFTAADAQAMFEAVEESRERLLPWLPWAAGHRSVEESLETVVRMQARWLLREDLAVGVFERTSGRLLGGSGLHRIGWRLRAFEIGYWLRTSAEGQGYVAEAVQLLTRLAFGTLGANRVEIRMDPANERSRKVPERLGFVLEGRLRRCAWGMDGHPRDRLIFALIPEDFQRLSWATPA